MTDRAFLHTLALVAIAIILLIALIAGWGL